MQQATQINENFALKRASVFADLQKVRGDENRQGQVLHKLFTIHHRINLWIFNPTRKQVFTDLLLTEKMPFPRYR